jgi:hypothetical protein
MRKALYMPNSETKMNEKPNVKPNEKPWDFSLRSALSTFPRPTNAAEAAKIRKAKESIWSGV